MENEKIQDEKGSLLLYKNARPDDIVLLLALLAKNKHEFLAVLRSVVSDDSRFLELLDIFAGFKLEFPERRRIYKTLEKITMYNYIKNNNYADESYNLMTKQFNRRPYQVKLIVETMNKFINSNGLMSAEDLENKLEEIENNIYDKSDSDAEEYEKGQKS